VSNEAKVNLHWIHSDNLDKDNVKKELSEMDGILVAPGFGSRGVAGKIDAVQFARENQIPFLGICLGMQLAVIEIAKNLLKINDANSEEFASFIFKRFFAISITANCIPRQIPKNGIWFSRANCTASIFPATPLEPKPGATSIPSISDSSFFTLSLSKLSECIQCKFTLASLLTPA
jgi:hypothetical protein